MNDDSPPPYSPRCGTSDRRNAEYAREFSPRRFFDHLIATDRPTILDVGAHRGESIHFFKSIYPESQLYSFEPDPGNFAELKKVAEEFGTHAIQAALGETEGACPYYRQGISHMGGLLPIDTTSTDSLGYAQHAENEAITVRKTTLDNACADLGITQVDILKIDVQGYESKVIEGAAAILKNTDCISVEILLYDLYGKTGTFVEVVRLMDEMDFSLWDVAKLSKNPKNLRTDWIEAVYVRNGR